jgi:hypothetical protein
MADKGQHQDSSDSEGNYDSNVYEKMLNILLLCNVMLMRA